MTMNKEGEGVEVSDSDKKHTDRFLRMRRNRSLAIGLFLGFLVLLFYVGTVIKLGEGVLDRPL